MTTQIRVRGVGFSGQTGMPWLLAVLFAATVAGCGAGAEVEKAEAPAPPAPIVIGSENVVTVARGTVIVGPIISGELRPQREATVRAELGGQMLQVTVEEGQSVRRGQLLGRIETRTLESAKLSAQSMVRSAENALGVATREAERAETLVKAGALAARDVDVARSAVASAEAQLADARNRLAAADRELADAIISAPIAGIISRKSVNTGDVVGLGTELFTIIDPSSMRLEASVPSDDLRELTRGAMVNFQVRGYEQALEGAIERIAPEADATTRQVPIFVAVPNTGGRLVSGLFAEGRVISKSAEGMVVPANAVNRAGPAPWVLRVTDGRTEKVDVTLGLTDPRTERVQIASGVAEGDILLRGASQGIVPGTAVQVNLQK